MLYRVTKQYGRGADVQVAQFTHPDEAKAYIQTQLAEDVRLKVKATYKLWEGMDILQEFTEAQLINRGSAGVSSSSDDSGSGASGSGKRSGFQPTPFNAAPRPSGMPHSWVRDEDDKDEKNK